MEKTKELTREQLCQKAEELKCYLGMSKNKNIYDDANLWTRHQELQSIYHNLLLSNLDFALNRKVEVNLWNSCFKDYISYLQNISRDKSALKRKGANEAHVILSCFLDLASASYLVLLQELKTAFDLDFSFLKSDSSFGIKNSNKTKKSPKRDIKTNKNCIYLTQHCLVHLGDIARYKNQLKQAESFYRQALEIAPGSGQGYNQIALIKASKGDKLSATYYYVRSLALKFPFPAASSNLSRLLNMIELDQKSMTPSADTKVTPKTFSNNFLYFIALTHHAQHLKTANKICYLLTESLTSIIAFEGGISSQQLIQIVTIILYTLNNAISNQEDEILSKDEKEIIRLLSEFLSSLLNAFLLPIYTHIQGENILNYFGLPATKLILDWISLNPKILDTKGFLKRLQIWPSLCRMLNDVSRVLESSKIKLSSHIRREYPLPEECDLQAFLPLLPTLKKLDFKLISNDDSMSEGEQSLVRGHRLIDIGLALSSSEFLGTRLMKGTSTNSEIVTFEAIEQKLPPSLVRELETLNLESSSSEEMLKCTDDSEMVEQAEKLAKKSNQKRTNIAMAAIMRKSNESQQSNAELPSPTSTFVASNESPILNPYSQNSSRMTVPHHNFKVPPPSIPAPFDITNSRFPPLNSITPGSNPPGVRGNLPRPPNVSTLPIPKFSPVQNMRPPSLLRPNQPSAEASSNPWGRNHNLPTRSSNPPPNLRPNFPRAPIMTESYGPTPGVSRFTQPPFDPNDIRLSYHGGSINSGSSTDQLRNLITPQNLQPQQVQGPAYSLFSGPSWPLQNLPLSSNSIDVGRDREQNMFQSGTSALEQLLREHKRNDQ